MVVIALAVASVFGCKRRSVVVDDDDPRTIGQQLAAVPTVAETAVRPVSDLPPTCEGACTHYLRCRKADASTEQGECLKDCNVREATTADLAEFLQKDCPAALAFVEKLTRRGRGR